MMVIIDGGGNRPAFDSVIAEEADLSYCHFARLRKTWIPFPSSPVRRLARKVFSIMQEKFEPQHNKPMVVSG
jgi:hypothetical protein